MATITASVWSGVMATDRRPFSGLFLAQLLSVFGNSLTAIANPWFVLETTGSVSRTGLVAAASVVLAIIAMAFRSAAVDRFGFRRLSIISDLLSMVSVAAIPLAYLAGQLSLPLLITLVFLGALFDAPGSTARSAMLPDVAERAGISLERANGLPQGVVGLATLAGPVVGGLLIGLVGASNVLWFNAATFLLSVVIVAALVPAISPAGATEPSRVAGPGPSYQQEVRDGWRFVMAQPLIRQIMFIATAVNFITTPIFAVLLPALVNGTYGEPRVPGLLLAGFGAGSLVGTALYSWMGERLPRFPLCVAGVGVFAVACAALGLAIAWPVLVAVLFLTALISAPVNPVIFTVLQTMVPIEFRARAMGAVFAMALLAAPAGLLLSGALVETAGLAVTFAAAAIVLLLITGWMAITPLLRQLDSERTVNETSSE